MPRQNQISYHSLYIAYAEAKADMQHRLRRAIAVAAAVLVAGVVGACLLVSHQRARKAKHTEAIAVEYTEAISVAMECLDNGDPNGADRALEKAGRLFPGKAYQALRRERPFRSALSAGYACLDRGDVSGARAQLSKAGELLPEDFRYGILEKAIQAECRRAAETESLFTAMLDKVRHCAEAGDLRSARNALELAGALLPEDPRYTEMRDLLSTAKPMTFRTSVGEAPIGHVLLTNKLKLDLGSDVSITLVLLPHGSFTMGSATEEAGRNRNEGPQRLVKFPGPFYLGITEVTQAQYEAVMGENPSFFKGANLPVDSVSWADVCRFCQKLGGTTRRRIRPPTEAEWEYACRAQTTSRFPFGRDDSGMDAYAWYKGNSEARTHPVGQKKPNAWGLYDMHGNVAEWCLDYYAESYDSIPKNNPEGPDSGDFRVWRGGGYNSPSGLCRSACRGWSNPSAKDRSIGFRILVDPFAPLAQASQPSDGGAR